MDEKRPRGWFVAGTDTGVGKTHVGALVAATLTGAGQRVGVYKPVETGWSDPDSTDAARLWRAAGERGDFEAVCPQHFTAPLAPYLAAQRQGEQLDSQRLVDGLRTVLSDADCILIEGAGGLFSPVTRELLVVDLASRFDYPLLLIAPDRLGVMNQVVMAVTALQSHAPQLHLAGILLSQTEPCDPAATQEHLAFLRQRFGERVWGVVEHGARQLNSELAARVLQTRSSP